MEKDIDKKIVMVHVYEDNRGIFEHTFAVPLKCFVNIDIGPKVRVVYFNFNYTIKNINLSFTFFDLQCKIKFEV